MANDEIAKRYASAIYNIAKSSDSINEVREVLNILKENIDEKQDETINKFIDEIGD